MNTTEEIIGNIQGVRASNNDMWMELLRIAARYAPQETADILRKISGRDAMINDLLRELTNELKNHEADGVLHD